jgi:hypothetical protein
LRSNSENIPIEPDLSNASAGREITDSGFFSRSFYLYLHVAALAKKIANFIGGPTNFLTV